MYSFSSLFTAINRAVDGWAALGLRAGREPSAGVGEELGAVAEAGFRCAAYEIDRQEREKVFLLVAQVLGEPLVVGVGARTAGQFDHLTRKDFGLLTGVSAVFARAGNPCKFGKYCRPRILAVHVSSVPAARAVIMPWTQKLVSVRVQTIAVAVLCAASLLSVLASTVGMLRLEGRGHQAQDQMKAASRRMAVEAEPLLHHVGDGSNQSLGDLNEKLRAVSNRVLADHPGVEGGFFISSNFNRFVGYGYPTNTYETPASPTSATSPSSSSVQRTGLRPTAADARGDEPPPREAIFVLVQAQSSLALPPGESQFDIRRIGPSRVAVLTEPIGNARPAAAATWTLYRLSKPEDLATRLFQFELSTLLALGGILLAIVLTINLRRILKRQRQNEERLREELRRAEHLAGLGKLLAGVAHEVRNPLAAIRSTVQLWERLPDTARTPASMGAVINAVDRLSGIVTRLLAFSRVDHTERKLVDLNQLLGETLELLNAEAQQQGVTIARDLDPKLPPVNGAGNGLRQVFMNLGLNSLQAMPKGGNLRCTTRYDTDTKVVKVTVEDTGNGVSDEDRKHLFDPFFTTRPDGTGLGLALCREIVTQHGGRIELATENGSGATFRIELPAAAASNGRVE